MPCQPRTVNAPSLSYATAVTLLDQANVGKQIIGADASRRSVVVICDADSTNPVYLVQSATAPASSGLKLKPGASITLNTTAAIYCVSPTGDGTVYAVSESGVA